MQAFGGVHHGERDRAGLEALGHVAQWTGDPQHLQIVAWTRLEKLAAMATLERP